MKTFVATGCIILSAIFTLPSCKQDIRSLDLRLSPVTTLVAPQDQQDIKLQPVTGGDLVFQWQGVTSPDSGLILYQVAFDKESGDFTKPIYETVSDGSGLETQASISQKELNKVASLAGIAASSSGKVKWTVIASKGANQKVASVSRTLILERPAGFVDLPDSLYLTGGATEAGNDVSKALPFKKTSDGVFELYTSLKAGTYQLTDKRSGGGTTYYIDTHDMIQKGSATTQVSGATKVYRLTCDFNIASFQQVEIQSLGLYMAAYNKEIGQLTYAGNSTWTIDSLPVVFMQFSWGRDDRYKYILHTPSALEYWGSINGNNVPPAGQPASYFYLVPVTSDQWNNTFKFDPAADGHQVDVKVFFQATGPYTQQVTYLN